MSMEEAGRSRKAQELNRKIMATHGTWEDSVEDEIPDIIAKHISDLREDHDRRRSARKARRDVQCTDDGSDTPGDAGGSDDK